MKIFHKDADYAVRALIYLAMRGKNNYISVTTLAGELGLPLNFLRRICSALVKADILITKEGVKGGVRLDRMPESITVLELVELFHGSPSLSDCTFRKQLCPNRNHCVLRRRILGIEQKIEKEFESITIQSLIDDIERSA